MRTRQIYKKYAETKKQGTQFADYYIQIETVVELEDGSEVVPKDGREEQPQWNLSKDMLLAMEENNKAVLQRQFDDAMAEVDEKIASLTVL